MLLRRDTLERIVAGDIDLVYRLWRRPTVRAGGRLRTAMGELAIVAVDAIDPAAVTDAEARRAGLASADEVRAALQPRPQPRPQAPPRTGSRTGSRTGGTGSDARPAGRTARPDETSRPYRVEVRFAGDDTRLGLRDDVGATAVADSLARLDRIDARAPGGPWTRPVLELIAAWPGRRAPELAAMAGRETLPFKADVRRLKELGLTISLPVGYRLSARGEAVLAARPAGPGRPARSLRSPASGTPPTGG